MHLLSPILLMYLQRMKTLHHIYFFHFYMKKICEKNVFKMKIMFYNSPKH